MPVYNLQLLLFHYPHGHMPQELGIITHYYMYICSSTARDIFLGILYGYKMVMQVIAFVLAFSTRKVKVKGLNDAKVYRCSHLCDQHCASWQSSLLLPTP